jgi:hypothetical protein
MSRHRLEPRSRVRLRLGRVAAAGLSLAVTMVALLGFVGLIPMDSRNGDDQTPVASRPNGSAAGTDTSGAGDTVAAAGSSTPEASTGASRSREQRSDSDTQDQVAAAETDKALTTALPTGTGEGRRVVFSQSAQRVWLVNADGKVASTYLVSGSVTDNLGPGKYDVFSRSRWAVGIDDSGVMEYFVRFANGPNAAIGFHSIPTKNGQPLQTEAQLGTPQSHGCIRQKMSDAVRMWEFAGVGTDVVVVA